MRANGALARRSCLLRWTEGSAARVGDSHLAQRARAASARWWRLTRASVWTWHMTFCNSSRGAVNRAWSTARPSMSTRGSTRHGGLDGQGGPIVGSKCAGTELKSHAFNSRKAATGSTLSISTRHLSVATPSGSCSSRFTQAIACAGWVRPLCNSSPRPIPDVASTRTARRTASGRSWAGSGSSTRSTRITRMGTRSSSFSQPSEAPSGASGEVPTHMTRSRMLPQVRAARCEH